MSTQPQTEDWINGIRNQKLSLLIYLFIYYSVCVDERIKEMVGLFFVQEYPSASILLILFKYTAQHFLV